MWILLLGLGIIFFALLANQMDFFGDSSIDRTKERRNPFHALAAMRVRVTKALRYIQERNPISNLPISQAERVTVERCEGLFTRFLRIVHDPIETGDLRTLTRTYGSVDALLGSLDLAIHESRSILSEEPMDVVYMKRQVRITEELLSQISQFVSTAAAKEVLQTIDEDMRRNIPRKLEEFQRRLNELHLEEYSKQSLFEQNHVKQEVLNISEDVAFLSAILKLGEPEEEYWKEGFQSGGNPYAPPRELPEEPAVAIGEKARKVYFREPFQSLANPYGPPSDDSPGVLQGREYLSDLP
jgi:hypothetical protein